MRLLLIFVTCIAGLAGCANGQLSPIVRDNLPAACSFRERVVSYYMTIRDYVPARYAIPAAAVIVSTQDICDNQEQYLQSAEALAQINDAISQIQQATAQRTNQ